MEGPTSVYSQGPREAQNPALLLVDVLHGFLSPEGTLYHPDAKAAAEPLRQLRDTARAAERLIVYAMDHHRPGVFDFELLHVREHCVAGEADAEPFEDFVPADGALNEIAITKRRYSAFYGTELDMLLREHRIDTVVLAGVKTNVCLRATAQDAFAGGYRVIVPRDATCSNRPHLAEASLEDIEHYFGRVVELQAALDVLACAGAAQPQGSGP
jgi:nicotinamidase-related amidase